ncbi:transposase [Nitrosomonas eutropha]|uniref:Transposase n=1 Tax=Nitrosomonas eutropha TaxID=916 RepID=A0ABX5M6Q6_9PROT|nr:transposase [Nitrosomonas eutropha]SEJ32914.1 Transposase [Nitrosomonas eutropha]
MIQEKPKVYTAEFRESSVKLAIESDKPVAQTAREIGVNENTLHTWISKYSRPVDNIMMCQHFSGHKVKQHFAATRNQRAIYIH